MQGKLTFRLIVGQIYITCSLDELEIDLFHQATDCPVRTLIAEIVRRVIAITVSSVH